jgi:pimeloyl-ACP methyl ester carboxylesterase
MLRRIWLILAAVLVLGMGYLLLTDNSRIVPYRNAVQYLLLRRLGAFEQVAEPQRGTLQGTVRTRGGQPITDATVLLPMIDGTVVSTETDGQGQYTLQAPAGSYVPVAGAPSFDDAVVHTLLGVGIAPNQTTRLDITLEPRSERAVTPPQEVQIGAPQGYVVEKPLPATAIRREITYTVDGRPNQPTFYYTPNDGGETPLPVLLAVYPGPAASWEIVSLPLAQAGYAVIAVGPAYALDLEPDIDDLERLIGMTKEGQLPRADGSRIGALGGSYSSLHVLRLTIRDPQAIDAALLLGPPTDIFELRRLFEEGTFFLPFGLDQAMIALGLPSRAPERYWRYSARYHARDINIPLMLIHSKEDEIVPFTQSEILAEELRRLGKPHELIILEGLSHYLYAPEYASEVDDLFRTTVNFFDQQLSESDE